MDDYERGKREEQDWWIKWTGRWTVFWLIMLIIAVLYYVGTGQL